MVQVNRVCLKILFINRPQFLVDSNELRYKIHRKTNEKRHSTLSVTEFFAKQLKFLKYHDIFIVLR